MRGGTVAEHKQLIDVSKELSELEAEYEEGEVWEQDEELFLRARVYAMMKSLLKFMTDKHGMPEEYKDILVRIEELTKGW
jgi:predicted helicase